MNNEREREREICQTLNKTQVYKKNKNTLITKEREICQTLNKTQVYKKKQLESGVYLRRYGFSLKETTDYKNQGNLRKKKY